MLVNALFSEPDQRYLHSKVGPAWIASRQVRPSKLSSLLLAKSILCQVYGKIFPDLFVSLPPGFVLEEPELSTIDFLT